MAINPLFTGFDEIYYDKNGDNYDKNGDNYDKNGDNYDKKFLIIV